MTYAQCPHCGGRGVTGNPPGITEVEARLDAVGFTTRSIHNIAYSNGPLDEDDFNAVFRGRLWSHFPQIMIEQAHITGIGFLDRCSSARECLDWWADWAAAITAKNSPPDDGPWGKITYS